MSFLKQFSGKELKYGYAIESTIDNTSRVVKLPKLSKIRLTPTQTKFIFYGTRGDILKWMEENSSIIVEFDTSEDVFSPPSTPRTLSTPSSPLSSYSDQSFDSKSNSKITFDLFGQQIQNSSIMTDNLAFYRPLHFAMNYLPWLEVILEIRPSEPAKDSKYDPVRRVILNSGITLGEVAKALEKSWKNILPDNCPIKSKLTSISDNGCSIKEYGNRINSFSIGEAPWIKHRDKSPEVIPPGILTPYNMEEALSNMEHVPKKDDDLITGITKEQEVTKEQEATKDKEELMADLPLYENVYNDLLLERGSTLKRPIFYDNEF